MRSPILLTAVLATTTSLSVGATLQWTGGTSVNWNTAGNWTVSSGSDADGIPDADDVVEFYNAAANLATNNDRTAGSSSTATLSGLVFLSSATTAASIAGNAISFGAGNTGITVQSGAADPTITASLTTTSSNNLSVNVVGSTQTLTTGIINVNGTGSILNLTGAGTVKAGGLGSSTYNLVLDVDAGTLDHFTATQNGINRHVGSGGIFTSTSSSTRTIISMNSSADASTATVFTGNLNVQIGRGNFEDSMNRTQTFTGNNTYTGTTSVRTGTLKIDGTTSGQGSYTVTGRTHASAAAGAILAGTGTIGLAATRTVTVDYVKGASTTGTDLATIAPGTVGTVGTLTIGTSTNTGANANALVIGGSNALSQGGRYLADIAGAGVSDLIVLNGNLDLSNTNDRLQLNELTNAFDGDDYLILDYSGTRTGKFSSVYLGATDITSIAETGFVANGNTYQLVYDDVNAQVLLTVPEPASLSLLAMGGIGLLRRRRA